MSTKNLVLPIGTTKCSKWTFLELCHPLTLCWTTTSHYVVQWKYNNLILFLCSRSTRSSQWWSGRSTTAHIVFDLRLLIWGFGKSCRIVHGITSEPENVLSNVLCWHCRRSPTVWLQFERETFQPPVWWVRGTWELGIGPFDSPPIGSY